MVFHPFMIYLSFVCEESKLIKGRKAPENQLIFKFIQAQELCIQKKRKSGKKKSGRPAWMNKKLLDKFKQTKRKPTEVGRYR